MPHPLETEYALTSDELLDAINRRFRAKVTLEGAVAEVHLGKKIKVLQDQGVIERFEPHDSDGYPDYTIWLPGRPEGQLIECKNIRNSDEAFRQGGVDVAYKVETQKTRTSNNDPSSRFYEAGLEFGHSAVVRTGFYAAAIRVAGVKCCVRGSNSVSLEPA